MKKFSLVFLVSLGLYADGAEYLQLNKPHRLIGDKVRVRATPDTKADIIAELPIGYAVTPTEQTPTLHTQGGVEAPWYKVSFLKDGKKAEGYIWGNLIAKGFGESKDGLIFLYGVGRGRKEAGGFEIHTSQIRVARNAKEISKLTVDEGVGFQSRASLTVQDGRGFTGVSNIVSLRFEQEYCGGKGNIFYVFWTGKKLILAHSSLEGFDAPSYATEKQIFPDEKDGKKDQLLIMREQGDHDDPKSKNFQNFSLRWTGEKLEKIP